VSLAEDGIDRALVVRRRFERQQARSDALEVALGLLDKQRSELVL
jgi:hypothetical protein